jgi:hypothetical protein
MRKNGDCILPGTCHPEAGRPEEKEDLQLEKMHCIMRHQKPLIAVLQFIIILSSHNDHNRELRKFQ